MFAKFENGRITLYHQPIHTEAGDIFTNEPDVLARHGYFPLICAPAPEVDEHHYPVFHWELTNNQITQVWEVEELPEEANDEA